MIPTAKHNTWHLCTFRWHENVWSLMYAVKWYHIRWSTVIAIQWCSPYSTWHHKGPIFFFISWKLRKIKYMGIISTDFFIFKDSANQISGLMSVSMETSTKLIKNLIKTVFFLADFALTTYKFHFLCILSCKKNSVFTDLFLYHLSSIQHWSHICALKYTTGISLRVIK